VPLVVGLWLALVGYTVAWAGWRNLGISYQPQADGSIKASQPPVTLLDAFTGGRPPASTGAAIPGPTPGQGLVTPSTPVLGGIVNPPSAPIPPAVTQNPLVQAATFGASTWWNTVIAGARDFSCQHFKLGC
jgi:hypothetical protein